MQLTPISKIKKQNLIFHKSKDFKLKNSNLTNKRLKIDSVYSDNKQGPLVIESPFLFNFGVSERKDIKSNKLTGYCLPICLWEKDSNPKPEEHQFHKAITKITDICYRYLESEFGPELANDLKSPLYFKKTEYTDSKGKKKNRKNR